MIPVLICICGVLVSLAGDYFLKTSPRLGPRAAVGILFYASSAIPVYFLYRRVSWLYVMLLWGLLMSIGVSWVGIVVLREKLSGRQWLAFVLAIAALVLWNWGTPRESLPFNPSGSSLP